MSKHNVVRNMNQPASPLNGPRRISGQTPKTPSSPTIEQLLHSDATRRSGSYSPASPAYGRDHEAEEDHAQLQKKSVLAKVKERAIRWRQNLRKKKQSQEGNSVPSSTNSLNKNDDGPDGDPEYLGAPMYESEMAPEVLKETARQHPREVTLTTEKHALPNNVNEDTSSQEKENPPNSPKHKATEENKVEATSPSKTLTESVTAKLAPAYEAVTEKLAPTYATISEKTHNIAAKPQSLTVSTPSERQGLTDTNNQQTHDKGVSVKEYLFQKFEPGDDEKALSKAISEATSPKGSDGKGVVEKVKEAVSSLLWTQEATSSQGTSMDASTNVTATPSMSAATALPKSTSAPPSTSTIHAAIRNSSPALSTIISTPSTNKPHATNSTSNYQASSYVHEAVEEENHGKILQMN